ncbi:putative glycosyltransferase EpsF [bacterium BMS3Bbin11]|nr:putative glycosyltransferase EpsF [bacterium BMS3Bbin11]
MRIVHIITGLHTGGAEMMLYKLLSQINRDEFQSEVISLTDTGPIADKIGMLGIPVHALGMKRGSPFPFALIKLTLLLREKKPDLVQTWMYHSDLIGGIAAKLAGGIKIFWNIRQADIGTDSHKRSAIWIAKVCEKTSSWLPDKIICCSHAALEFHFSFGYAKEKMLVIPNGFDLETFQPDKYSRIFVHKELGLDEKTLLVGLVARFHPQKDHRNFIQAAELIRKNCSSVQFILCGNNVDNENIHLKKWIKQAELEDCFHLLGVRRDVSRLVAAMDVAVSSSLGGEGFPNVIGEAMACSVPCVVTDVGDSALIVGDTGRVVPAKDSEALATAIIQLLEASPELREELGKQARLRVENNYSLESVVKKYEAVYRGDAG